MLVKDIMTKKVVTVKETDNLATVLSKFSKYKISGMPVIDKKGELKGMVTESDVLTTLDVCLPKMRFDTDNTFSLILQLVKIPDIEAMKRGKHCEKIKVKEFMQKKIISIKSDDNVIKAAELMNRKNVKRLAVVDKKKLVGIVARADIIKALAK